PLALRPGHGTLLGELVPAPVPIVLAALVAVGIGWAVLRWSDAPEWSPEHQLWLAGGILVSHTAFMAPAAPISVVAGVITIALEIFLLMLLARRVRSRV
ncbi:MAG TPA: hypothetical protein VFH76_21155, partial [Kribbella sp.]|nr:hypothetical protein [Kribbella sp.]